ncbi:ABC transporter ATP-binding protein [Brenneria corticis]|uniref:ABC-type dipeptide transporter n=1 Tax=Brenneria corticis TaxID=2173106 RepID=A0A2U1TUF0_9GAMM|nr:ABC transporter ATP-binding protein [Brenneria sp. CFCC 11842]PWC13045.1 ABC transporter ATP-binding protein [Brenneria sp. CFCC 11842]
MSEVLLTVENLHVRLPAAGGWLHAVRGVSLNVARGRTHCLVGESGCGKSITALSLLRLLPAGADMRADAVRFQQQDMLALPARRLNEWRGARIAMIFQEPMTALNPVFTIGDQLISVFRCHRGGGKQAARQRAASLLERVGIPDPQRSMRRYPHQLSGGQRQRVLIAMALMCEPPLIVADEPTTALDVTVQKQILDLLSDLQREFGLSLLLITHDLGVVAHYADDMSVMYAGQIVESGPVEDVLRTPRHPYTRGLIDCIPAPGAHQAGRPLTAIPGQVPSLLQPVAGCAFASRCPHAADICRVEGPQLTRLDAGRMRRCHAPFEESIA